jgi:hypothetical protein
MMPQPERDDLLLAPGDVDAGLRGMRITAAGVFGSIKW